MKKRTPRFMIPIILIVLVVALWQRIQVAQAQDNEDQDSNANTVYLPSVMSSVMSNGQQNDVEQSRTMVVRIYFTSRQQLHDLVDRLDVFEETTVNGYAVALVSQQEFDALQQEGIRVEVDAERTERLFTSVAQVTQARSSGIQALDTIPGYACYRTVEETYSRLSALATANPNLATWTDVGDSWDKLTPNGPVGYDIYSLVLTNKSKPGPKPKFMLIAAIHAREYTTAELATRFAEELLAKYNLDADVTWLLDYFEIHILSQVNPDGRKIAEAGNLWRKNRNNTNGCTTSAFGTDLNRNSSFKWGLDSGSSPNACDETYRGRSAASEPEVQSIQNYADAIFPDQRGPLDTDAAPNTAEGVFITLHSYSELVLAPWGWTTSPSPNATGLQTLGRKFGYYNGYQVCNGPACLYDTSGTTDDYTYGTRGIASYTFEIGRNFFETCNFFTSNIIPKNMPALYYAAKAARRPYQNPAGPDVTTITVNPATVAQGTSVNLSVTADDTRYNSNGGGIEPTQAIQAVRYSIDSPSWAGGTVVAMTASDGGFNTSIENANAALATGSLALGRHTLFFEAQDVNGNWGVLSAGFMTVTNGTPPPTGTTKTFSNTTSFTIPDRGNASIYPSAIAVSGMTGTVSKVIVRLKGFSHTYPDDLDVLLVGPGGQKVLLLSDAGGSADLLNHTITLDDAAAAALPNSTQIASATYKPTNYGSPDAFAAPAPAAPYAATLSAFNGRTPNGTWNLYVVDDSATDAGRLNQGWELTITSSAVAASTNEDQSVEAASLQVEPDTDTKGN